jgi:hypothetical protein
MTDREKHTINALLVLMVGISATRMILAGTAVECFFWFFVCACGLAVYITFDDNKFY